MTGKKPMFDSVTVVDEEGNIIEGPLADAITKAFQTGKGVVWNEGDDEPTTLEDEGRGSLDKDD